MLLPRRAFRGLKSIAFIEANCENSRRMRKKNTFLSLTCSRQRRINTNFRVEIRSQRDMKTFSPTPKDINREWYVVDAQDKVLGRLAAQIAHRLRGKHKPEFAPHMDNGDFIIVVNCEKIRVTGNKLANKKYYRHSGYVGGLKEISLGKLLDAKPQFVLMHAVKGMLPKNRLGRAMLTKLRIYSGAEHPHAAQTPKPLALQ
jgi:large subunit ribosomal protein L13